MVSDQLGATISSRCGVQLRNSIRFLFKSYFHRRRLKYLESSYHHLASLPLSWLPSQNDGLAFTIKLGVRMLTVKCGIKILKRDVVATCSTHIVRITHITKLRTTKIRKVSALGGQAPDMCQFFVCLASVTCLMYRYAFSCSSPHCCLTLLSFFFSLLEFQSIPAQTTFNLFVLLLLPCSIHRRTIETRKRDENLSRGSVQQALVPRKKNWSKDEERWRK